MLVNKPYLDVFQVGEDLLNSTNCRRGVRNSTYIKKKKKIHFLLVM